MEHESINSWIWDGVYYHPHLFGGLMLTAALLGLSTSYFAGIAVPSLPYSWYSQGLFHKKTREKKRIRVYMDGCFDLMHYGHANALRQAKALGDELVVGVVSDEEIVANKGPPVLSMEERLALVSGLKWVDEVIPNAPYAINEQFMRSLFNEHKIDYIIHGDDPCLLPDGTDAYALAKKAGRYKQIKRTEGVSSTDIGPGPNARVVYIDGAFDLFHAGHVEILKSARQLGDFLLVGIYPDHTVSLSVLACRYVDEVIIGAPSEITKDMIITFNISLVVHGTVAESNASAMVGADPYAVPKSMGIFRLLESPKDITTTSIAQRIVANHEAYTKRNAKKTKSEKKYYAEKKIPFADRLTLVSDALYEAAKKSCSRDFVNVDSTNTACVADIDATDELTQQIPSVHVLEPNCKSAMAMPGSGDSVSARRSLGQ
ncbi:hypothetical protein CDL15_Pgr015945 [Punica granatum]|uniref:ethanolamine-phosphate cytidylyltransferase n=1 Tax=Punica granatum TaxID=22663 RepID=A0A218XQH9_PUNGR|nr:hypothetical protein CDL15_Pgr015945 [Punica granatum]